MYKSYIFTIEANIEFISYHTHYYSNCVWPMTMNYFINRICGPRSPQKIKIGKMNIDNDLVRCCVKTGIGKCSCVHHCGALLWWFVCSFIWLYLFGCLRARTIQPFEFFGLVPTQWQWIIFKYMSVYKNECV